jgi:serine/threonine-protein kinase
MGQVDLVARQEGTFFRLFAIKRLRPDLVSEAEVRTMFLDEARIAGLIRHPNVVSVVDVGENDAGPFLVMEFVEGVPLSELIAAARSQGEQLPIEVCLRIALQVAEGLHAAHELRDRAGQPLCLVHRDVSPHNVLVGFDGIVRITDFGIAKALGSASKTSTGILKGKLGYLSPEQLRFEEPDRRADLFALGVVLFEMLAGTRLYANRKGTEGPRRILNEPPPDLADYRDDAEPELVELMFSLLAKQREHRPPDANAVARRLENLLMGLVATRESVVDVSAYLERVFPGRRDVLQRELAEVTLLDRPAQKVGARRRRSLAIGAGVLAGAVALSVGVALGFRKSPGDAIPAAAASQSTTGRAGEPQPASPTMTTKGQPAAPASAKSPLSPEPAAASTVKKTPPKSAAPRRWSGRAAKSRSGVPVWESY